MLEVDESYDRKGTLTLIKVKATDLRRFLQARTELLNRTYPAA